MTGSMNLARDTANVATAAVRLSQVVGALEYKGEAERLQETQRALKHSLEQLATAPLAQQEPALVGRIIQRSQSYKAAWKVCCSAGNGDIWNVTPCSVRCIRIKVIYVICKS